ncbi:MAG: hypothetical protein AB1782_14420 [Cyanobacteriota bacterium]
MKKRKVSKWILILIILCISLINIQSCFADIVFLPNNNYKINSISIYSMPNINNNYIKKPYHNPNLIQQLRQENLANQDQKNDLNQIQSANNTNKLVKSIYINPVVHPLNKG